MSRFIRQDIMEAIVREANRGRVHTGGEAAAWRKAQAEAAAPPNTAAVTTTGAVHIGTLNIYYGHPTPPQGSKKA